MSRRTLILACAAILLVALGVRLPTLLAGLPYTTYVDEGHVMQRALHLLAEPTWVPETYSYPSLPFYLVAGAALAYSPIYEAVHGHPLRDDLSPDPPFYYDIIEPPELVVLGRAITLLFSLGVVVLTGMLVGLVAGQRAGLVAAWLAALVPALVARSGVVNVNPLAAFFALAALIFAERARRAPWPRRDAILAGVMVGLAAAAKYPAVLVCLPVALAIVLSGAGGWRQRALWLVGAGAAAAVTMALCMPALLLRTADVLRGLHEMDSVYGMQEAGSYWAQALRRAEWDLPLEHPEIGETMMLLALAGLVVACSKREWRPTLAGWALFAAATLALLAPYRFRAFRNLLVLVPLVCALIALLYAWTRARVPRRRWVDAVAVLLPLVLWTVPLWDYVGGQLRTVDTRTSTVRWLRDNARPRDRVAVIEELAFLPLQLAKVPGHVEVMPWRRVQELMRTRQVQIVVAGDVHDERGRSQLAKRDEKAVLSGYRVVREEGSAATSVVGSYHRGNAQHIWVLRRKSNAELRQERRQEEHQRELAAAAKAARQQSPAPPTP